MDSLFSCNGLPRLIVSGSANNDLEWEDAIPNFQELRNAYVCNSQLPTKVATQILCNFFINQDVIAEEVVESHWKYFAEKLMLFCPDLGKSSRG